MIPKPVLCLVMIAGTTVTSFAHADGLVAVEQAIFGMDCAPCAYGIERGLKKLPGAASVTVSLNQGRAAVTFQPGSTATLQDIREVIRHNGFTPKDARATVEGRVTRQDGATWLAVGGTNVYRLIAESAEAQAALSDAAVDAPVRFEVDVRESDAETLVVRRRLH